MDLHNLETFFKWCTLINGGLLLHSTLVIVLFPDFIYRVHSRMFKLSRETLSGILYGFLGIFKIMFFFLNLVPYLALHLMQ